MKLFTFLLGFTVLFGCAEYGAKEHSLTGIENNFLLETNHVSNTKSLANKPTTLCKALTTDENDQPTKIKGYVVSNNREIATLYFHPEDTDEFESRNYFARIEMNGDIVHYENADKDALTGPITRNAIGQVVIVNDQKTMTFDSISLDKVREIRKTIKDCQSL